MGVFSTDDIYGNLIAKGFPLAIVSGSGSNLGRSIIGYISGECPTFLFQDWFTPIADFPETASERPDFVFLPCDHHIKQISEKWSINGERLLSCGKPAFSQFNLTQKEVAGLKLIHRNNLGIVDAPLVVFVAGHGLGTAVFLANVLSALHSLGLNVCVIIKAHPRLRINYGEEVAAWDAVIKHFKSIHSQLQLMVIRDNADPMPMVFASDVLVSEMSTLNWTAHILDKRVVCYTTGATCANLKKRTRGLIHRPYILDIVEDGAVSVKTIAHCTEIFRGILTSAPRHIDSSIARQMFQISTATARVAHAILERI